MSIPAKIDSSGEFDELFVKNSSIHVERMNTRAFWIGITGPDGATININTGIADGEWFFNVEEDAGGDWLPVRRPACHRKHASKRRAGA